MSDCGCEFEAQNEAERATLRLLLVINAAMFIVECSAAALAHSAGLLADSLDMLADASVYGISLYAVGRSVQLKVRAASLSGLIQILLGCGVVLEVGRRFIYGSSPESTLIMGIGALAFAANLSCVALVAYTASSLPDLIIGLAISALVIRGGIVILREAKGAQTCSPR